VHKDLDIAKQQQRGNVNNITAYLVEHDATGSSQLNWVNRAVALGLTNTSSTGHARNTPVMQRF
jgi:hypothetical protein